MLAIVGIPPGDGQRCSMSRCDERQWHRGAPVQAADRCERRGHAAGWDRRRARGPPQMDWTAF